MHSILDTSPSSISCSSYNNSFFSGYFIVTDDIVKNNYTQQQPWQMDSSSSSATTWCHGLQINKIPSWLIAGCVLVQVLGGIQSRPFWHASTSQYSLLPTPWPTSWTRWSCSPSWPASTYRSYLPPPLWQTFWTWQTASQSPVSTNKS
jgi:hypothetical protein